MLGHKRVPSREGGIEVVVEELSTRMVRLGHKVTCYCKRRNGKKCITVSEEAVMERGRLVLCGGGKG